MDIFDIFDKIFSAVLHLNYVTIFLTILTLLIIGLLIFLGFSSRKSRIEYYNYTIDKIKKLWDKIRKWLDPLLLFLNSCPFQAVLVQFAICYLIFFSIFITHPWPINKRWPKTTNAFLIGGLVSLIIVLFIQFNVPFSGGKAPTSFVKNLMHIEENYGKYISFLVSTIIIVTFSVGLSYLAATNTEISYLLYSLLILGLVVAVATILFNAFRNHLPKDFPSPQQMLMTIVFVIPAMIFKIIMNDIHTTSYETWVLVAVEVFVLFVYFILPLIINYLYLKNPRDADHISLMKQRIKGAENSISSNKEALQERKGGINLKWEAVPNLSDEDVKLMLFGLGYTTSNVDATLSFVRSNQKAVGDLIEKIRKEKHELAILRKEMLKDKSTFSSMLLRDPVFTDIRTPLGKFENLRKGNDYEYQYTLSSWIFLHEQPPNHSYKYNKFTSLLNYGNKPNITYNMKKNLLRITMLSGKTKKIVYETNKFPMQKWNNIVINYDKGTLDIFINAKLVSTTAGIVPYMRISDVVAGDKDGLSGGICNVVYYSGNLSRDRIEVFYNFLKNRNPPVVMAPTSEFYKRILKRGEDFYYKHSWLTIAGVMLAGYLIFGYSFRNYSLANLAASSGKKIKKTPPPYKMRYKIVLPDSVLKQSKVKGARASGQTNYKIVL